MLSVISLKTNAYYWYSQSESAKNKYSWRVSESAL